VKEMRKVLRDAYINGSIEGLTANLDKANDANKDGSLDKVIEQCKNKINKAEYVSQME
jgi:hypothetical protein